MKYINININKDVFEFVIFLCLGKDLVQKYEDNMYFFNFFFYNVSSYHSLKNDKIKSYIVPLHCLLTSVSMS
jgi:hypothetical protein